MGHKAVQIKFSEIDTKQLTCQRVIVRADSTSVELYRVKFKTGLRIKVKVVGVICHVQQNCHILRNALTATSFSLKLL
jgi:hypothetical protein